MGGREGGMVVGYVELQVGRGERDRVEWGCRRGAAVITPVSALGRVIGSKGRVGTGVS
jgi:hypothetical protein